MNKLRDKTGASFLATLLALAIALLIAWLVLTRLMGVSDDAGGPLGPGPALDSSRQQRTIADMRAIARANELMRVNTGHYATSLDQLEAGGYMVQVPKTDAWGNPFSYSVEADSYTLESLGSDGRQGPAPPSPWTGAPYEPDLNLENGQLSQAPSGR